MTTSGPFNFAKYRRPHFEGPIHNRARAAEIGDDQMTENLSDLLGRVSENSTGGIDSLIGEFERLRGKLRIDSERIQREIEEYKRDVLFLPETHCISGTFSVFPQGGSDRAKPSAGPRANGFAFVPQTLPCPTPSHGIGRVVELAVRGLKHQPDQESITLAHWFVVAKK
jgi:hypothetical protein